MSRKNVVTFGYSTAISLEQLAWSDDEDPIWLLEKTERDQLLRLWSNGRSKTEEIILLTLKEELSIVEAAAKLGIHPLTVCRHREKLKLQARREFEELAHDC